MTIANRVSPSLPFVGLRDRAVLREAVGAVIEKGYRRLFFVGPFDVFAERINLYEIEERYAGFQEAIQGSRGVEGMLLSGSDYVPQLRGVDLAERRTAVICASDIFALEILSDLRARGVAVPKDVGLMGFDSIDALRYVSPSLSTVEYPIQRMAEIAFSLLIEPPPSSGGVPFIELDPRIHWADSL